MLLSDISVKRPVFATVCSILLVALGLLSFQTLPLRELPDIDPPIVGIGTAYRGASADIVDTRITQVLEDVISGIEGIEEIESVSRDGQSNVTITFSLSRNIDNAANDVRSAVARVVDDLPEEADPPEVAKVDSDAQPIMWFNLASDNMNRLELTDFAERFIVDRMSVVQGVARVQVGGAHVYAMRIWIDRSRLAARNLTVSDVAAALRSENVELPAGRIESTDRQFTVRVDRAYQSAEEFSDLVLAKGDDGYLIRLRDVARVERGPEETRSDFHGNGQPMVGLGIVRQSTANTLDVARGARAEIDRIRANLPDGTFIFDSYDSSIFVDAAVNEVFRTLLIAIGLVVLVIYLFLGSARAALIPAVTVPVSLVASFMILAAFGLSINLLTLLALVLSIGLVVDDSIVVLENVQRRVDMGEPPLIAAFRGTRQVGFAVIATTLVIISVFLPIAFLTGNVGRLFSELAVAVAAAVAFSSFIALTLSAMLCSKLLVPGATQSGVARVVGGVIDRLTRAYTDSLETLLRRPVIVGIVIVVITALGHGLFRIVPSELAPAEDRGSFFINVRGPEGGSFANTLQTMRTIEGILLPYVDKGEANRILLRTPGNFGGGEEFNTGIGVFNMTLWEERARSGLEILNEVRGKLSAIPDAQIIPIMPQGFGRGSRGQQVQFVIGGTNYDELAAWRDIMIEKIAENPGLVNVDADLRETQPQLKVQIDLARAADLGVSVSEIGGALETMLGGRRVTSYLYEGEEYDVIIQGEEDDQRRPDDLTNIFVRSARSGELIPLSNLVRFTEIADPARLNRYNRLRAVTISASLAQGTTLGEALDFLERTARENLPSVAQIDYKGQSREYRQSSSSLAFTFGMALLIVFLVLAAQFESFIHPFVIMLTVPIAVAGGLYGLFMVGSSLNIYSQIGVVILVGLAAKNGILVVEFANQLRDAGLDVREAVRRAAETRFRPIVMTGLSTAFGAMPLVLATGAGAASRITIGIVIVSGVAFATLLTLFIVPVFYQVLAPFTRPPSYVARELEAFEDKNGGEGEHAH
ncbi:MAG: efflux RND transporter permease subunit [Alphaproteobacteria bacterium]